MPKVNDVLARVRDIISDPNERRWTDTELFRWIDDAQRLIIQIKPELNAQFIQVFLHEGAQQELPDNVMKLIDFPNLREVDKYWLDRLTPSWQSSSSQATPEEYMRDPDKRVFYVYPPSSGGDYIMAHVGLAPEVTRNLEQELAVEDEHVRPIAEFVCYKALSKDSENPANKALADGYLGQFYASLGVAVQTEDQQ